MLAACVCSKRGGVGCGGGGSGGGSNGNGDWVAVVVVAMVDGGIGGGAVSV